MVRGARGGFRLDTELHPAGDIRHGRMLLRFHLFGAGEAQQGRAEAQRIKDRSFRFFHNCLIFKCASLSGHGASGILPPGRCPDHCRKKGRFPAPHGASAFRIDRRTTLPAWPGPARRGGNAAGARLRRAKGGVSSACRPCSRGPVRLRARSSIVGPLSTHSRRTSPRRRPAVVAVAAVAHAVAGHAGVEAPEEARVRLAAPAAHADGSREHLHPQVVRGDGIPVAGCGYRPLPGNGHIDARIEGSRSQSQCIDPHGRILRRGRVRRENEQQQCEYSFHRRCV